MIKKVRCLDAAGTRFLKKGTTYTVISADAGHYEIVTPTPHRPGGTNWYLKSRFKLTAYLPPELINALTELNKGVTNE